MPDLELELVEEVLGCSEGNKSLRSPLHLINGLFTNASVRLKLGYGPREDENSNHGRNTGFSGRLLHVSLEGRSLISSHFIDWETES